MPDGDKLTAQAADGTLHVFPFGTDHSIIDQTMKVYAASKPGSYMTRKGGPILNTKDLPTLDTEADSTKRLRGAGLGLAEGAGIQPGATGWETIKNTLSSWGSGLKNQTGEAFQH